MRRISAATPSTYALGATPAAFAFSSIFCPCSSVPVWKNTSYPCIRRNRAMLSASTISYVLPMCGLPEV